MLTRIENDTTADPPKPLKGVGIVVADKQPDGSLKTLGIVFSPTVEKMQELIAAIHGSAIKFNLADVRGGEITLERP